MILTREYKETVVARIQRDPKFAKALYAEDMNALLGGETAGLRGQTFTINYHPRSRGEYGPPISDFQSIPLPLMRLCADGKEHAISETTETLADQFKLSDDERNALLPSGVQEVLRYRFAWAKSHLKMAGLLEAPKRGIIRPSSKAVKRVD